MISEKQQYTKENFQKQQTAFEKRKLKNDKKVLQKVKTEMFKNISPNTISKGQLLKQTNFHNIIYWGNTRHFETVIMVGKKFPNDNLKPFTFTVDIKEFMTSCKEIADYIKDRYPKDQHENPQPSIINIPNILKYVSDVAIKACLRYKLNLKELDIYKQLVSDYSLPFVYVSDKLSEEEVVHLFFTYFEYSHICELGEDDV